MAVFDEAKVINSLHPEKAEVGKKYYFAEYLGTLKERVESDDSHFVPSHIEDNNINCCFSIAGTMYALLYPYEEPPKKLMSVMQFIEWVARGNGVWKHANDKVVHSAIAWDEHWLNEETVEGKVIRPWGVDEWIEPTVDIYERNCK